MKHFTLILLITLFMGISLKAQVKIGDNPQNIDPSSILELESSSRVLVITRVTTTEMNAIAPSQGALVYNTDIQCVHYYNGSEWINLCESVSEGGNFTTDPIVNVAAGISTIVITPTADGNNFEVALNSIQSDQIQDGGIIGADIQDNSITANKLSDDSVGRNELATNAVGIDAIDFSELNLASFANTPGFLTSANIVSADPDNDIESRTDGAFFDQQPLLDAIDTNNTAIIDHITADNDTDIGNEILDVTTGNTSLVRSGTGTALDPFTIAVDMNGITSNEILNATIVDADISDTAAIDGTKINPDFGDQNTATTGTLAAGNTTVTGTLSTTGTTTIGANTITAIDGTNGQVLTTDGAGAATWQNQTTELPTLTDAQIIVADTTGNPTAATITGDASIDNAGVLTITPNIIDNADISDEAAIEGVKINPNFVDHNISTTGTLAAGNTTITGTLDISGQTTINTGDNSTSLPTDRGAANQVLTTNGNGVATWQDQTTELPTLTDAQIIVANATGNPTAATITGDASISNTGALTIANNSITNAKIEDDAVNTAEIVNGAVTLAKINEGAANEVLKTNAAGTDAEWGLLSGDNISGSALTSTDLDVSVNGATSLLQNVIIDINNNAITNAKMADNAINTVELVDNAVTIDKIGATATDANRVLGTDASGDPLWVNRTDIIPTGTAGSIFFSDGAGNLSQNNAQLFWDETNTRLGIGTNTGLTNELTVAGTTRTSGLNNSNGSAGVPSYRFSNNGDTGMYLADVSGVLAFSTNNNEAIRIDASQNVGIGTIIPSSTLHTGGSFATAITTTTGALTLDGTHHTIIIGNNHNITLPLANSCMGRIYIIKNTTVFNPLITPTYINSDGSANPSTIELGVTQLQSDGTDWQQIN